MNLPASGSNGVTWSRCKAILIRCHQSEGSPLRLVSLAKNYAIKERILLCGDSHVHISPGHVPRHADALVICERHHFALESCGHVCMHALQQTSFIVVKLANNCTNNLVKTSGALCRLRQMKIDVVRSVLSREPSLARYSIGGFMFHPDPRLFFFNL